MKSVWISVAAGLVVGLGFTAAAQAFAAPQSQQAQSTPKGFNWEFDKKGNRVPKGNRVINADGSWREEVRAGKCVTVKEKTAAGEFKSTTTCGD
ncbi:MAG: hypothetical protein ACLGHC_08630 [Alphaproteobacteria bacterium]